MQGRLPKNGRGGPLRDERGVAFLGPILLAILAVFGLAAVSMISWKFLLATLVIATILLAVVGAVFFKLPFKYVIVLAVACLGIVVFLEVSALVIAGLLVLALAMWRLTPYKQPAIFVGLIGIGVLMVIWGSTIATKTLGLVP